MTSCDYELPTEAVHPLLLLTVSGETFQESLSASCGRDCHHPQRNDISGHVSVRPVTCPVHRHQPLHARLCHHHGSHLYLLHDHREYQCCTRLRTFYINRHITGLDLTSNYFSPHLQSKSTIINKPGFTQPSTAHNRSSLPPPSYHFIIPGLATL